MCLTCRTWRKDILLCIASYKECMPVCMYLTYMSHKNVSFSPLYACTLHICLTKMCLSHLEGHAGNRWIHGRVEFFPAHVWNRAFHIRTVAFKTELFATWVVCHVYSARALLIPSVKCMRHVARTCINTRTCARDLHVHVNGYDYHETVGQTWTNRCRILNHAFVYMGNMRCISAFARMCICVHEGIRKASFWARVCTCACMCQVHSLIMPAYIRRLW